MLEHGTALRYPSQAAGPPPWRGVNVCSVRVRRAGPSREHSVLKAEASSCICHVAWSEPIVLLRGRHRLALRRERQRHGKQSRWVRSTSDEHVEQAVLEVPVGRERRVANVKNGL